MNRILFTAAGCPRCSIAKKFMQEKGLGYEEHDIGGEGKELFSRFYRDYRSAISRGKEGIEFPVLSDGASIRQGVAPIIAHLTAGTRLDRFHWAERIGKRVGRRGPCIQRRSGRGE